MSEFSREILLNIIETDHVQCGEASALARMALAAMDSEPVAEVYQAPNVGICAALGPSIRMLCPLEPGTKLYRHAQPAPVVPEENHIGSKNALDAIVSFIEGKSNPTVKCYEEVSEQLFKDNCHGIHSHVIEYILKLGEELEDLRAEQAEMQPVPVAQCPYPCGWDTLNKLAIQDAAFVSLALVAGEPATESIRQAAITNSDRLLKVISACRAAMLNGGKS